MSSILDTVIDYLHPQKPTPERPFGIYLWPIFSEVCVALFGWNPSEFRFIQGTLPLSTLTPVIATITAYYVIILGGREVMRNFAPLKLTFFFRLHNFMLTFISGLLLTLFIEQLFPIIYYHGLFYGICDAGSWTQPIVTLYYVEFIDTIFLFLKKKPLTFLHCFHHGATAALCYSQLVGHTSVSWVVITLNLFVHVIMYWYYFLSSCGIRVWWKEWVTRVQIIQFLIDVCFIYFATYTYFVSTYAPSWPAYGTCAGEEYAAIYGCALITSYLVLFIGFYINVYNKRGKRIAAKKAAAAVAASEKPAETDVSNGTTGDSKTSPASPVKVAKKPSKKV